MSTLRSPDITLSFSCSGIDWDEAVTVFERAPLGAREPLKLKKTFENSYAVCFAFANSALAGMGRAISDGVVQAAVYDMVVLPEYQGVGVGKRILQSLLDKCEGMTVTLYAMPEKIPFYQRLGFEMLASGMARFRDPVLMREVGILHPEDTGA